MTARMTVAEYLAKMIEISEKTQKRIAHEVGYTRPNVLSMMKQGEGLLLEGAEYAGWDRRGMWLMDRVSKMMRRETMWRLKSQKRLGRVLARYRGEAEARRRRALRRWIEEITKRTQLQP